MSKSKSGKSGASTSKGRRSASARTLKGLGVAAGVAAGVAGTAYATQRAVIRGLRHRPDPDDGRLGALPVDSARRLPSHDGGNLYTVSAGPDDVPPLGSPSCATVVLSHGVTIDSRVWVKQMRTLPEAGVRAVAFDHRGHGQSVCGDSGHSVENLAWDVRTVLEGLDLYDVVLVGHSMGGVAVQSFAIRFPEIAHTRVRGLVLLSSLAKTQLSTTRRLRCAVQRASDKFDLASVMARPDLGTMFARLGFGREPLASHVELARQMLADCTPDTSREAIAALIGLDLTPDLPSIDLPTLVICGTNDLLTPPYESRRIARLIPGARLEMVERAGHMIMLERAERLDHLILDFAREVGAFPVAAPGAAAG
jgi:3-oxoadipate enol-lactonase